MRRTFATFMILVTFAAGCGSDDDAATTPASSTEETSTTGTTAPSESTATSAAPTTPATDPPPTAVTSVPEPSVTPGHVCPHLKQVLLALTLVEQLPRGSGDPLPRLAEPQDPVEALSQDDIDALAAQGIGLYQVPDNEDPLVIAIELSNSEPEVPAAPVLLVTPAVHWTFGPGRPYVDESGDLALQGLEEPDDGAPVVGVVDTGYTESAVPWLASHVEAANPNRDAENATVGNIKGHGTFVASIIARHTPKARVVVAGMANVPPQSFQGFDSTLNESLFEGAAAQFGNGYNSDELQLYSAIRRLIARQFEGDSRTFTYSALNLSVGSYQCDGLSKQGLAIWAGLQLWYDNTDGAPVIAAAGNHGLTNASDPVGEEDFIPGQIGGVTSVLVPTIQASNDPFTTAGEIVDKARALYGVQSVDSNLNLSDFSNVGAVSAIGEDICGVRVNGQHTTWSGSSFATAVVTAAITADRTVPLNDPLGSGALSDGCTIPPD